MRFPLLTGLAAPTRTVRVDQTMAPADAPLGSRKVVLDILEALMDVLESSPIAHSPTST